MPTDYPIRISKQSMKTIESASTQLKITSKKNVLDILVEAGANAKKIKLEDEL